MTALPLSRPRPRRVRRGTPVPLLVVVPEHRPARHPLLWTVLCMTLLVLSVFGAVTFNAMAADDAVLARQLELEQRDAEVAYGQLLSDVAALESPARIAAEAAALGLVRADAPRLLSVQRLLPADGAVDAPAEAGDHTDVLKPLLARD